MSLRYLFGNVDESGKLQDADDLPEELYEDLNADDGRLDSFLGFSLDLESDDASNTDATSIGEVKANADAEDFAGITNEELDDESFNNTPELPLPIPQPLPQAPSFMLTSSASLATDLDEDYDAMDIDQNGDGSRMHQKHITSEPSAGVAPAIAETPAAPVYTRARLAELFPGFEEGDIKFTDVFSTKPSRISRPQRKLGSLKASIRKQPYPVARDDRELFRQRLPPKPLPRSTIFAVQRRQSGPSSKKAEPAPWEDKLPSSLYPLIFERWEDNVIWEDRPSEHRAETPSRISDRFSLRNYDLEESPWEDMIQWEPEDEFPSSSPIVSIAENVYSSIPIASSSPPPPSLPGIPINSLKKFNLSQDHHYGEQRSLGSDRVRQTYGPGILQHALPAIKLHPQYFKYHLSKKELRSFHRPTLKTPLKEEIHFSRVRTLKRKKLKGKDASDIMKNTKDISLKDASRYVLMEYSEEYPLIMMNAGMGSLIYNYYRKAEDKDTTSPQLDLGAPFILEEVDSSPFMGFGDVEPGQTLQALSNNMFRAPIFRHEPPATDFLVIRHTFKGQSKYYIREIPFLFVVGQALPLQEVPKPQSRKITSTAKGRLQIAAYRNMRKYQQKQIRYDDIVKLFSHWTEAQFRQRLKEFAQFAKKGENTGWWKLKNGAHPPSEDEIRRLVTPEMVCLQESTMTGEQRLIDIGYTDFGAGEDENDEEEMTGDIEMQLAPWVLTKNFVLASQNKSMIKLYGPGDPSGRGEAFSFIRASMKEPFLRYGETEEDRLEREKNKPKSSHRFSFAEQQQVYREEIKRIWNAQLASLTTTVPPFPDEEEQLDMEVLSSRKQQLELDEENERRREYGYSASSERASSPPIASFNRDNATFSDLDETTSVAESGTSYGQGGKMKRLTIRRLVRNTLGEEEEKAEVITDMKVINAYIRQRAIIESQDQDANMLDEELERRIKKQRVLEHVNKMKEVRKEKKRKGGDGSDEERKEPVFLKIRAPSAVNPLVVAATSNLAKKRQSAAVVPEADYLQPIQPKSYGRRRAVPEVALATILEKIISDLISIPEAYEFCKPVSAVAVPDYYNIVKKPRTLEQIRDSVREYRYKTARAFMEDLELIVYNCRLYNGPLHPLTNIAEGLAEKAQLQLNQHTEEVSRLEREISEEEAKLNMQPQLLQPPTLQHQPSSTISNTPMVTSPVGHDPPGPLQSDP